MKAVPGSIATALLVLSLPAGGASAHNVTFQGDPIINSATLTLGGVTADGVLAFASPRCENGTKVTLFHDLLPVGPDDGDFEMGSTTSNGQGRFHFQAVLYPEQVYATTDRKVVKRHVKLRDDEKRKKHVCAAGVSPTVPTTFVAPPSS